LSISCCTSYLPILIQTELQSAAKEVKTEQEKFRASSRCNLSNQNEIEIILPCDFQILSSFLGAEVIQNFAGMFVGDEESSSK
jgi:hypothetical protein